MHVILLLCAISIVLHKIALLWSLSRNGQLVHHRVAFFAGAIMCALAITSIFAQAPLMLFGGYAAYRISVAIQILAGPHKAQRQTPLIPVNLSMGLFSLLAAFTAWWLFPIAYLVYWTLTWQISRKRMGHKIA
ncbi:MAG: hypothetical protein AAFV07_18435 [Bacteroidota bacterium]